MAIKTRSQLNFIDACERNDLDRVKRILERTPEANKSLLSTALKIAMDLEYVGLYGYLMSKGAKFNNYTKFKIHYKTGEKKYLYV